MLQARAEIVTPAPDRYIRQLVSHLGHKLTTEIRPDGSGLIAADYGQCMLTAATGSLVLEGEADTAQGLAHIQDVVARHLERFGARAALQVNWRDDAPGGRT